MIEVKSVKTKILALSICAILLTAMAIVLVVFVEKTNLKTNIDKELDVLTSNETAKIAMNVYLMCRAVQESVQQKVISDLKVTYSALRKTGTISLSEENTLWDAVNQNNQVTKQVSLPKMIAGNTSLCDMDPKTSRYIMHSE